MMHDFMQRMVEVLQLELLHLRADVYLDPVAGSLPAVLQLERGVQVHGGWEHHVDRA